MELTFKIATKNKIEIKRGDLKDLVTEFFHNNNISIIDNRTDFINVDTMYYDVKIYCNPELLDLVFAEFKRLVIGQ